MLPLALPSIESCWSVLPHRPGSFVSLPSSFSKSTEQGHDGLPIGEGLARLRLRRSQELAGV